MLLLVVVVVVAVMTVMAEMFVVLVVAMAAVEAFVVGSDVCVCVCACKHLNRMCHGCGRLQVLEISTVLRSFTRQSCTPNSPHPLFPAPPSSACGGIVWSCFSGGS
jgi:hypothetical protein